MYFQNERSFIEKIEGNKETREYRDDINEKTKF